jgi:hypothetical protein
MNNKIKKKKSTYFHVTLANTGSIPTLKNQKNYTKARLETDSVCIGDYQF